MQYSLVQVCTAGCKQEGTMLPPVSRVHTSVGCWNYFRGNSCSTTVANANLLLLPMQGSSKALAHWQVQAIAHAWEIPQHQPVPMRVQCQAQRVRVGKAQRFARKSRPLEPPESLFVEIRGRVCTGRTDTPQLKFENACLLSPHTRCNSSIAA